MLLASCLVSFHPVDSYERVSIYVKHCEKANFLKGVLYLKKTTNKDVKVEVESDSTS